MAAIYGSLPKLPLPGDNALQSAFNRDCGAILCDQGIYRRDAVVVIPYHPKARLEQIAPEHFISWVEGHLVCYRIRKDAQGDPYEVLRSMPKEVARCVLADHTFALTLPEIRRTFPIPTPVIEAGRLHLCTPGYDPATGTFVFESQLPQEQGEDEDSIVSIEPTAGDSGEGVSSGGYYDDDLSLHDAACYLHDLLHEFPFYDWSEAPVSDDSPLYDPESETQRHTCRSMAVQIGAMLSHFAAGCVPAMSSRMGFAYNANAQRSGKTLLVKTITIPVGSTFKAQPWRDNDEEMTKILDSETLAASPYICFDNARGIVASQPLEAFMTAPTWTGRVLRSSQMFTADNNALIFVTGNNLNLGTDMQHRLLWVELYAEDANIQSRTVTDEINDRWLAEPAHQHKILSAMWAIVRHWNAAGRPTAAGKLRKGFEDWCRVIGGMVEFAGFGDMLAKAELENSGDHETQDIHQLVATLARGVVSTAAYDTRAVVEILYNDGLLNWMLDGREHFDEGRGVETIQPNRASSTRIGHALGRATAGTRGLAYHVAVDPEDPSITRTVRFYAKGKGRNRRFIIDVQTN